MAEKQFDNNLRGAIWESTDKNGAPTYSGQCEIEGTKYYINFYPVENATGNMPKFRLKFSEKKNK